MIDRLHDVVSAVCPIDGVSVGTPGDSSSVRVNYRPEASPAQQDAAVVAVSTFDWTAEAHATWEENRNPERRDLLADAAQAVTDNQTFLAVGSPTNAQILAQVRALTRQNNRVIRRLVQLD